MKGKTLIIACALLALASAFTALADGIHFERTKPHRNNVLERLQHISYSLAAPKVNFHPAPAARPASEDIGGDSHAPAEGEIFYLHPSEEEFNQCTVIDGNGDGNTLKYDVHTSGYTGELFDWPIYYERKNTQDADEWLITMPFTIANPEKKHAISVEAVSLATGYIESFEVAISKSADVASMTQIIMDEPYVENNGGEFRTYESNFAVSEAGEYYLGIHVKSPNSNSWRLVMRNITVRTLEDTGRAPGTCTVESVTADPQGGLSATVSLMLPANYIDGGAIPASEMLTVDVASPAETMTITGQPGEKKVFDVKTVSGENVITFTARNDGGVGNAVKATVRCGVDRPRNPAVTASCSDDNMSVTLSWTLDPTGANGGPVDPKGVTYNVYQLVSSESGYGWLPIVTGHTDTQITISTQNATQMAVDLMVSAQNSAGESDGALESSASVVLGKPYPLPVYDDFDGKNLLDGVNFGYPTADYTAGWALDDPAILGSDAADDNQAALICGAQEEGATKGQFISPKFSLSGSTHPRIELTVFCYSGTPTTDVYLYTTTLQPILLGTISATSGTGWTKFGYDVPAEALRQPWLYVLADIDVATAGQYFILDKYEVYERHGNDFRISNPKMPATVALGEKVDFTAVLSNRGHQTTACPEIHAAIVDGENEIMAVGDLKAESTTVGTDGSIVVSGSFTINKADHVGSTLGLKLMLADDDDNGNNTGITRFKVVAAEGPVVTDLSATRDGDGAVTLTWSNLYGSSFTDNFESYAAGTYSSTIGIWKNLDFDGLHNWGLGAFDVPDAGTPKAFQVLNADGLGLTGLPVPSGRQLLCAMSPQEGLADDWLISPEVEGGTQVVFQLTPVSDGYEEVVEVMYSTGEDDADSFKLLKTLTVSTAGWDEYMFTLPDDAKYFAIHYASNDQFGIFLDDLTCTLANPPFTVTGFNVYRNDERIAENVETTSYTDANANPASDYRYNVAAVGTRNGVDCEFPLSNTATVVPTGIGSIAADASEEPATTYNLQGIRVNTGNVPAGIYLRFHNGKATKYYHHK